MNFPEIAEKIRTSRKAAKLTQSQLADRCGLARQTIVEIERSNVPDIGIRKLMRILTVLGLEIEVVAHVEPTYEQKQALHDKRYGEDFILTQRMLDDVLRRQTLADQS